MSRFLFAVRTLIGPWVVVPLVVLEVLNLAQRGSPYLGEAMWTIEWLAISLFLTGPLIAGFAAVDASRLSGPGAVHLVVAGRRPRLVYVRAAVWCAGPAAVVHLLALVVALGLGGFPSLGSAGPRLLVGFVVQVAVVFWFAAVGSMVGRFVPVLVAGFFAAVVGLGLFYRFSDGDGFLLLDLGSSTITRIGLEWNLRYLLWQLLIFVVGSVGLVSLRVWLRDGRPVMRLGGGAVLVVVIVVTLAAVSVGPTERTVLAAPVAPSYCDQGEPVICFYPEHKRHADRVIGPIRYLFAAATDAGYDAFVPQRVEQSSWSYRGVGSYPDVRLIWLPDSVYTGGEWPLYELIQNTLLAPAHCPQMSTGPSDLFWRRLEDLTNTWYDLLPDDVTGVLLSYARTVRFTPRQVEGVLRSFADCEIG